MSNAKFTIPDLSWRDLPEGSVHEMLPQNQQPIIHFGAEDELEDDEFGGDEYLRAEDYWYQEWDEWDGPSHDVQRVHLSNTQLIKMGVSVDPRTHQLISDPLALRGCSEDLKLLDSRTAGQVVLQKDILRAVLLSEYAPHITELWIGSRGAVETLRDVLDANPHVVLKSLRSLHIIDTSKAAQLPCVAQLPALRQLDISTSHPYEAVHTSSLPVLEHVTHLRLVYYEPTDLSDVLAAAPNLEVFDLIASDLYDLVLEHSNLKHFSVRGGLQGNGRLNFPSLQSLLMAPDSCPGKFLPPSCTRSFARSVDTNPPSPTIDSTSYSGKPLEELYEDQTWSLALVSRQVLPELRTLVVHATPEEWQEFGARIDDFPQLESVSQLRRWEYFDTVPISPQYPTSFRPLSHYEVLSVKMKVPVLVDEETSRLEEAWNSGTVMARL